MPTIKVNGQDTPVRELDFEPITEPWSEYRLTDGGRVRVKVVVVSIFRKVDDQGRPLFEPDGAPAIAIASKLEVIAKES